MKNMIYVTQLTWLQKMSGAWILRIALLAFALIAFHSSTVQAQWTTAPNGNDVYKTNTAGNVGIGTSTPTANLHVYGTANADVFSGMGPDPAGGPGFNYGYAGLSFGRSAGFFNVRPDASAMAPNPSLRFMTANVERMIITNLGNIGIGTVTPPTTKLEVVGDIKATGTGNINAAGNITANGTIAAKYQDVAEWVESSQALAAGTVVVLDHTKSNQVVASSESYDTRVAGVISAQPGITLGEAGANKVLVATTGRVRIKVDATRGPIHIGDLLVTSDVPGLAMKSEPIKVGGRLMHMPGTLIGKALEPLAKGQGEILVLLSLQ